MSPTAITSPKPATAAAAQPITLDPSSGPTMRGRDQAGHRALDRLLGADAGRQAACDRRRRPTKKALLSHTQLRTSRAMTQKPGKPSAGAQRHVEVHHATQVERRRQRQRPVDQRAFGGRFDQHADQAADDQTRISSTRPSGQRDQRIARPGPQARRPGAAGTASAEQRSPTRGEAARRAAWRALRRPRRRTAQADERAVQRLRRDRRSRAAAERRRRR